MSPSLLADLVADTGELATLTSLLAMTGLNLMLREPGPYTLFAPTDTAFARLPPWLLTALRADLPRLRGLLKDHLVAGRLIAADLMGLPATTAISGKALTVSSAGGLRVERSYLIAADQLAANGVVHQIDTVILLLRRER